MLSNANNEISSFVLKAVFSIYAKDVCSNGAFFLFNLMLFDFIYVIFLIEQFTRACFFSLTFVNVGKVANLGVQNKED